MIVVCKHRLSFLNAISANYVFTTVAIMILLQCAIQYCYYSTSLNKQIEITVLLRPIAGLFQGIVLKAQRNALNEEG